MTLNARLPLAVMLALILTILPLPVIIADFRPPWVLLVVLYIQFWLPSYFRVTWIFLLGLSLDVLLSSTIGEHAFALLLTSWFAASKTRRFHFFSTIQQMILVVVFCLIHQCLLYLLDTSQGYHYASGVFFIVGSSLSGMLFWPWIRLVADNTLYAPRN